MSYFHIALRSLLPKEWHCGHTDETFLKLTMSNKARTADVEESDGNCFCQVLSALHKTGCYTYSVVNLGEY